jgi:hypothetical protein
MGAGDCDRPYRVFTTEAQRRRGRQEKEVWSVRDAEPHAAKNWISPRFCATAVKVFAS